jgi:hypothetical protein
MKKITITSYKALSLIFALLSTGSTIISAPAILGLTIQFSKNSTLVAPKVDHSGNQIPVTVHETAKKITVEIPKPSEQSHIDLLITSATIEFQLKPLSDRLEVQNTVDYLKIDPNASYKYYSLDFIDDVWQITEGKLPESGRIPDRAIIVEFYPEWITDFRGGSALELPTLYLNNGMDELGTTEEDFKEALVKLELTALDSNIVHPPVRRKMHTIADKKRVLVMDLLT